jgi:hypothetical protein
MKPFSQFENPAYLEGMADNLRLIERALSELRTSV